MQINLKNKLAQALLIVLSCSFAACNNAERDQAAQRGESAWNDFKSAAERTEKEAGQGWREERGAWESDYDRNVARVDSYSTSFDENRKREYETYKTRYRTADSTNRANYEGFRRRAEMSGSLLGGQQISGMTAENADQMFKTFIDNVQASKAQYTTEDWKEVEKQWAALGEQYNNTRNVSSKDKAKIVKEQARYTAIKGAGNVDARVDINEGKK